MNHASQIRHVLVSGCSGDFGFRAARALARRGHAVVAGLRVSEHGQANQRALESLARDEGLSIRCTPLDVDDDNSVQQAIDNAVTILNGRLDGLVNSAAYSVLGPLEACEPSQLLALLNTNVVGALRLFRAVLPVMRAQGKGRIIQITSGLGRAVVPFMGPYAASAWAQECLAEVLSYEAGSFGIEVAILEPEGYREGGVPKKPVEDAERLAAYEDQLLALGEQIQRPDTHHGDPEDVARAVVRVIESDRITHLRTPIGDDAEELIEMRNTMTTGEWKRTILKKTGQD